MKTDYCRETIHYGAHERQVVCHYVRGSSTSTQAESQSLDHVVSIFIHGGAWRDPLNTCFDSDKLFEQFVAVENNKTQTAITITDNFYSIDYRLAPIHKFPSYLLDVLSALTSILGHLKQKGIGLNNDKIKINLIGHSVGATLILQVLNYNSILSQWFKLNPDQDKSGNQKEKQILQSFSKSFPEKSLNNIYLLDGIYNIESLIKEYPSYSSFVNEAHHNEFDYTSSSNFSSLFTDILKTLKYNQFVIVHSYQDQLLSLNQTKQFVADVLEKYQLRYTLSVGNFGTHNDVYEAASTANLILQTT
ncbi:arylformamidase [Ascoidea rubescens DSM 1968]|uniref:Alpha/beta-hydrolase n=1 Tax=Ascoidea rubescens DSM 1968 TaxID=1344418 RepID=A0A1D2VJX2_9ASCO|nr:alpha/beta-hydrolase [Ascoidea rubescens DSM 1968]ODV61914.1 alpha/beta-hydrolase [Ascoidea rubescens DSM 1968]